jgi:hypothetical protein
LTQGRPTPDEFEVYIGSFATPSYGVWWDGEQLVYESFADGYDAREQTIVSPSRAQWTRFWRTMDEIDVWSWNERYEPSRRFEPTAPIRDGTHWSLALRHGEQQVESSGDDAARGSNDPDLRAGFATFAEAVSRLTGGYPFS